MVFIGRKNELEYLNEKFNSKKSEFIIIYGRRRLGKTFLLKESINNKKNSIYFLLTEENILKNLESFRNHLSEKLNNEIIKDLNISSWVDFFRKAINLIPENSIIILDEFPYLINQDKSIISQFQKIYDEYLKEKNIKFILCGSSNSIMGDLISYQSPLYGRRTGSIKLEEFNISEINLFFKNKVSIEEIFKYKMIFGGVPYYLDQINSNLSFNENFENFFFKKQSIFMDEVLFLLKIEFKEVRNYLSIFKSISRGKNKFSEISNFTGVEKGSLSKYLSNLENLDLIKNVKSFFDKPNSKKSIYKIKDNFIYFWFSVIDKYLSDLTNIQTQKKLFIDLNREFGFLFEKECQNILSKDYEKLGSFFNKKGIEIDLIGKKAEKYDLFECKFKKQVNEKKILNELKEKIKFLPKDIKINSKNLISIDTGITLKDLFNKF